jgi:hypothetical protein
MSPAGSGRSYFRGGRAARADRANAFTWMLPLLLPAGLLGAVALLSLSSPVAYLLAGVWGWVVFPYAAAYVHAHSGADRNGNGNGEADYWRTKMM